MGLRGQTGASGCSGEDLQTKQISVSFNALPATFNPKCLFPVWEKIFSLTHTHPLTWRLCSRQARGLEASERGGGAPPREELQPQLAREKRAGRLQQTGEVPGLLVSEDKSPVKEV